MKASIARQALIASAVATFLAGCSPASGFDRLSAVGAAGSYRAAPVTRDAKGALLYASDSSGAVFVFTYPEAKKVTTLSGLYAQAGICSDPSGDVFIPSLDSGSQTSTIYEFAHGGTAPIAALSDSGIATSCAIDPKTGNLAVANDGPSVSVYRDASGDPMVYQTGAVSAFFCAYDDSGDLFIDGQGAEALGELPPGSSTFTTVSLSEAFEPQSLQWVGGQLIVAGETHSPFGPVPVYSVAISGSEGMVNGPIMFSSKGNKNPNLPVQYFLDGRVLIGPGRRGGGLPLINFWHYPRGGAPASTINSKGILITGITVSAIARD